MNKQLIERIALEALDSFIGKPTDPNKTDREEFAEYATEFLARIDAERGKEAVAWRTKTGYEQPEFLYHNIPPIRSNGEPLFLSPAPTIPEGWALVPSEKPIPDLMMAGYHEAIGWNDCRDAMIAAAQGERK